MEMLDHKSRGERMAEVMVIYKTPKDPAAFESSTPASSSLGN
jgi:hypothetical protein